MKHHTQERKLVPYWHVRIIWFGNYIIKCIKTFKTHKILHAFMDIYVKTYMAYKYKEWINFIMVFALDKKEEKRVWQNVYRSTLQFSFLKNDLSLESSRNSIMSFANSDSFTSFPIWIPFIQRNILLWLSLPGLLKLSFCCCFCFCFLGLYPWHMEVPRARGWIGAAVHHSHSNAIISLFLCMVLESILISLKMDQFKLLFKLFIIN